jgi:hypothetical protein
MSARSNEVAGVGDKNPVRCSVGEVVFHPYVHRLDVETRVLLV